MVEVTADQLRRWAQVLTGADSCMSLVYWRHGIETWDTLATPQESRWCEVMDGARAASNELHAILAHLEQPVGASNTP